MWNSESSIPDMVVEKIAGKLEAELGLSFAERKKRDLQSAIYQIAEKIGAGNELECADWLLNGSWDKHKADLCALYLTIGETYFFREPRAFELVCAYARQKIARLGLADTRLRIWSAGCSTGEEPYSIAMAIRQSVPELDPSQISILATDINPKHLQLAQEGIYRAWSFRGIDATLRRPHFFTEEKGQFRVNQEIRAMVRFTRLNLAHAEYPSASTSTEALDMIFCRNVLMYFSRRKTSEAIERFRHCLVDGGWLIVSPSEASSELFSGFSCVNYPDAIFFKKEQPPISTFVSETPHSIDQPKDKAWEGARPPSFKLTQLEIELPSTAADVETSKASAAYRRVMGNPAAGSATSPPVADRPSWDGLDPASVYLSQALEAIENHRVLDAIANLKRVTYLYPESIIGHYLLGVARLEQGRNNKAIKQFETTGRLLSLLKENEIVPDSDGMSAAYLLASVHAYMKQVSP